MKCILSICKLKYSVTHRSDRWCHALMPLSSACFIIFTSCCFCCIMQWKEFLLGNRANKLLVWTETQGQICGAVGDVETHVLWENCIVKNQCIREDFQSWLFYSECIFPWRQKSLEWFSVPWKLYYGWGCLRQRTQHILILNPSDHRT